MNQNHVDCGDVAKGHNLFSKLKRTLFSVLPVAKNRQGQCLQCGACCQILWKCLFLRENGDLKYTCMIYPLRPFFCRKYPRIAADLVTQKTCGFHFESDKKLRRDDTFDHN